MFLDKKSLKLAKYIIFSVSLLFVFIQTNPHRLVLAASESILEVGGPTDLLLITDPSNFLPEKNNKITAILPTNSELPYYTAYITATAYTSRLVETDASPTIAAWGDHVFWGMLASNAFPRGTKIQIPEYYGDKMFTILDRMNERYYHHLDIWMPDLSEAKNWGSRYVEIRIYK
jgi:3D (Asp-Asp-Asp) domain-containing protein